MASLKNTTSYVKFVRGTQSAWETLKGQNQVFNDTLYFIYENAGSSTGTLYLGNKQIGGGDGTGSTPVSLGELSDVILSSDLASKQILIYNGTSWINSTFDDIVEFDSNALELDEYGALTLAGFESAKTGQIPQVSSSGKLSWTAVNNLPDIKAIKQDIINVQSNMVSITKVEEMIAAANHLQYKIVDSLESIQPTQIENPDSYIYLVPTGDITGNNLYNEYMFIENKLEQVGNWNVNLADYVTKTELTNSLNSYVAKVDLNNIVDSINEEIEALENADKLINNTLNNLVEFKGAVGDLSSLITYEDDYTLVDQVNDLTERLTWQEILE